MDSLNLNPQERRLVAGVGLVVFVFLNIWLVWPHFSDWRGILDDRAKNERTLARYQNEVNQLPKYQAKLNELENMGSRVLANQQDLNLAGVINEQALKHGLQINGRSDVAAGTTQTNQFFDEKAMRIDFTAKTEALVNFLESLTTTNSLIRVRNLSITPDQPPYRLKGWFTLVASYQKNPPPAAEASVANRPAAAKNVPAPVASKVAASTTPATNRTVSPPPPSRATVSTGTTVTLPKRIPSAVKQ